MSKRHPQPVTQRSHKDNAIRYWFSCYTSPPPPRAASGVVRIDPLRVLAGCRKRRLNQALSVLSLSVGFLLTALLLNRATFCVVLFCVVCFCLLVVSTTASNWHGKTRLFVTIMRWLQLWFDFNLTAIRSHYDHSTTYVTPTCVGAAAVRRK